MIGESRVSQILGPDPYFGGSNSEGMILKFTPQVVPGEHMVPTHMISAYNFNSSDTSGNATPAAWVDLETMDSDFKNREVCNYWAHVWQADDAIQTVNTEGIMKGAPQWLNVWSHNPKVKYAG